MNDELDPSSNDLNENEKYVCVGSGSSGGQDIVEFINIYYSNDSLIRYWPSLKLRDLDDAMFLPFINKSLAEKVKSINIYSNGYKLKEINKEDLSIDTSEIDFKIPVDFSDEELSDPWVRIRPQKSSMFEIRFYDETPKRIFTSSQVKNSLQEKK